MKILILLVGIYRDQDPEKTQAKQLRVLYKITRSAFPNAAICLFIAVTT